MNENRGSGVDPKHEVKAVGCMMFGAVITIILLVSWIIQIIGK